MCVRQRDTLWTPETETSPPSWQMALYHFSVSVIKRSAGRSATGAAAYRAAEKIHDDRTGLLHDYTRKRGVYSTEILAPANAPSWVHQRSHLWNAVEQTEKRHDAQVAREIDVALPTELTHEQKQDLLRSFVRAHILPQGMVADVAYHDFNSHNPHAHLLLTMRPIEGEGFGNKNREWNREEMLTHWREAWAEHVNQALERYGHAARVDHRTLAAQGVERVAQIHLGAAVHPMHQRGVPTDRGDEYDRIAATNHLLADLRQQIAIEQDNQRLHLVQPAPETLPVPEAVPQPMPEPVSPPHRDRTLIAVQRQLAAMNASRYEIGLKDNRPTGDGTMQLRTWTAEHLMHSIPWLKRMNARGLDVYIRPAPIEAQTPPATLGETLTTASSESGQKYNSGLLLVDDVTFPNLQRILAEQPVAAVVESSQMNFQVWVRVSEQPLPPDLATAAAKILAARYQGDPNSASWKHFGRLSGFTNRKPEHIRNNGTSPYVLLHETPTYPLAKEQTQGQAKAHKLLTEARQHLLATYPAKPAQHPSGGAQNAIERHSVTDPQAGEFAKGEFGRALNAFRTLYQRKQAEGIQDDSIADWACCKSLAHLGYSQGAIAHALRHGRPDVEQAKKGHVEDYVSRTASKAFHAALAERQMERERD